MPRHAGLANCMDVVIVVTRASATEMVENIADIA